VYLLIRVGFPIFGIKALFRLTCVHSYVRSFFMSCQRHYIAVVTVDGK
jgi:hypothetical protein